MKFLRQCATSLLIAIILSSITTSYTIADTFENYSAIGGSTDREPNKKKRKNCKYYDCGPTSKIELTMLTTDGASTAILGDSVFNYDTGKDGTFEQMLKRGEDFDKNGFASIFAEMMKKGKEEEDKKIIITFPMIDYGYSGTFNNIKISVSEKNETLTTATREEYTTRITGFTGSVTIEKYSRSTMKGSYSGTLHRYENTDLPFRGPSPDQQVKRIKRVGGGTVSGEFTILNPWKGDDRITDYVDFQSAMVDPMKNDIKRLVDLYGIDMDVDEMFDKVNVNRNRNQSSSNASSIAVSIYGDCNCSCNFVETTSTTCKSSCEDAFKVCEGERYEPPLTIVPINPNAEPEQGDQRIKSMLQDDQKFIGLDKENFEKSINNELTAISDVREKYIALLEKKHPGEKMAPARKMMLQGFDSMPDDNSRTMMYMSLEGSE